MKEWREVFGTEAEQPEEFDTTASPTTVYQRRNIKKATKEDADGAKVACVQFTVRNDSENAISWDDVFSVMGEGVVCEGWGSAYNPYMGAKLNKFYSEQLDSGMQQDIWIVTTVSRVCFREKTWENLSDMEFEYVVSLYPDAVRIRLKTGKNYGGASL